MSTKKQEFTKTQKTKKLLGKKLKRALKPKNIGKLLIALATISLLATSILPYLF